MRSSHSHAKKKRHFQSHPRKSPHLVHERDEEVRVVLVRGTSHGRIPIRLQSTACNIRVVRLGKPCANSGPPGSHTDRELARLERIKQSHERLEAKRRHFEDLEFRHMEEESVLEEYAGAGDAVL